MKQTIIWLLSLIMTVGLIGCKEDEPITEPPVQSETEKEEQTPDVPSGTEGKILIVYFSRTGYNYPNQWLEIGHTARVANFIADLTGGDKFEILPKLPYPDNYQETVAIAREELNNDDRPEFIGGIDNLDEYNIVFVGGPVWHGVMPMIIRTFYDSYDLSSKTIVPFSTHAGSGLGDCERLAKSYYPTATVLEGLAVQGTSSAQSREIVETWLKRIKIIE